MTNEEKEMLFSRGVERIFPDKEKLEAALASGKRLRIYDGIDPTGPTLHIGHGATLLKLRDFQKLGHQIVLLFGDFTARIGDPSGKLAARKQLSKEEAVNNMRGYIEQADRVLDMNKVEVRYNSEWYEGMNLPKTIEIMSEFTVGQLIERDMFQTRLKKKEPIYMHELIYPMLQGYDAVMLDVDMEVGGNDQTFNMLAGRTMLSRRGKEKFVMAGKLLVDPTGKKMGKTEGNMIALSDTPENMYGKVMSWPDNLLPLAFEICTRVPMDEAKKAIADSPRDAKMRLAREIVEQFAGAGKSKAAEAVWRGTFQDGGVPSSAPTARVAVDDKLLDVLLEHGFVSSKAQYRRLIDEGAVRVLDGAGVELERVRDYDALAPLGKIVKIGRLRFLRLTESDVRTII